MRYRGRERFLQRFERVRAVVLMILVLLVFFPLVVPLSVVRLLCVSLSVEQLLLVLLPVVHLDETRRLGRGIIVRLLIVGGGRLLLVGPQ